MPQTGQTSRDTVPFTAKVLNKTVASARKRIVPLKLAATPGQRKNEPARGFS